MYIVLMMYVCLIITLFRSDVRVRGRRRFVLGSCSHVLDPAGWAEACASLHPGSCMAYSCLLVANE